MMLFSTDPLRRVGNEGKVLFRYRYGAGSLSRGGPNNAVNGAGGLDDTLSGGFGRKRIKEISTPFD